MSAWIGELGAKAGPLAAAAARFFAAPRFAPPTGEYGRARAAAGVQELAAALEAWLRVDAASEEEEQAFVEGAGAWLGLLLVDALGGAHMQKDGVHRVRLGEHGFYDPFGGVEAILEADEPRRELARQLRRAESEARGTGPIARVRRAFEAALPAEEKHRIEHHFCFDVRLASGIEVSLERAVRATEDLGDAAAEQAARKLAMLASESSGTMALGWDVVAERLFPRLVPRSFFDDLATRTAGGGGLLSRPFDGEVCVAYVLRHADRSRFVRADELGTWGVNGDHLHRRALENLARHSAGARFAAVETDAGALVVARTGDGLDAARLMLPSLHAVLRPTLGDDFLVAVPHRDALIAAPRSRPALVRALEERAQRDAARAPHRVTERLYRVTAAGVEAAG